MSCQRCAADDPTPTGWCRACELAWDAWNRRNATDILFAVLGGMLVVMAVGVGLPILGLDWIVAVGAAFGGFGMIAASYRALHLHRRRQFLASSIPRAYLPAPK